MESRPKTRYVYDNVTVYKRGRVPHWRVPFGLYFVTLRLVDALPREIELRLTNLRDQLLIARRHSYAAESAHRIEREIFRLTRMQLNHGGGSCWLQSPAVADMVMESCEFHEHEGRCDMIAAAVMPNHLHLVFRLPNGEIDRLMQSWKSFTAHKANELLGREGAFWQEDYFDVLMRDSEQLERTVRYVLDNPLKAGLVEWRWSKLWSENYASAM